MEMEMEIGRKYLQNYVEGMDDAWDVAEYGEEDIDKKVGVAPPFKEDTERREEDGEAGVTNRDQIQRIDKNIKEDNTLFCKCRW